MNEKKIDKLIEGSRYSIKSLTTKKKLLETEGVFRGFVQLGNRHGLKIEIKDEEEDEEHIRFIPLPMISYIDVIEEAKKPKGKKKKDKSSSYYG